MRSLRVLHVVGGMPVAGTETWLMHVLRRLDRKQIAMDFLVHDATPTAYESEIEALGAHVLRCTSPDRPFRYARQFRRILAERAPYDIVHTHVQHFGGFVAWLAMRNGIPIRVVHSHNDTSVAQAQARKARRAYLRLMSSLVRRAATHGCAASRNAASALFGADWRREPRWRVLFCGLDLEPCQRDYDRRIVRAELGIPQDAVVLGHVGRFVDAKNHEFLIEVATAAAKQEPKVCVLLVGDGPLRPHIELRVASRRLDEHVCFAGVRRDVPRLLRAACDAFIMPSKSEGLGLALVEAQAAGLGCVVSDNIPDEVEVAPGLIRRLSLAQGAERWADVALGVARQSHAADYRSRSLPDTSLWPFGIHASVNSLRTLYLGAMKEQGLQ